MTRGQNAVHVLPSDWSLAAPVLAPLLERIDVERTEPQLLILTADAESALAASAAVLEQVGDRPVRVVAATRSPRAARLLRTDPAHVVIGAPAELVALLQGSHLGAGSIRSVVFGWLEPLLGTREAGALETLMAELPKTGARVVLATELTSEYEGVIERYARRARREIEGADESLPLPVEYTTAAASARLPALRRLLDTLDLPQAEIYARSERAQRDALAVARALGYPPQAVRSAGPGEATTSDPLILLDLPPTRAELRALLGSGGRRLYAIVQPSQLASLRALAGDGALTPVAMLEAAERARGREAALRAALRELLTTTDLRREILAVEPLLAEFDGTEVAAAALRLLEQNQPRKPETSAPALGATQRLFVNLGERDGVRAAELVAAITAEAGIPGSQIGKIEVRDTHSLVEVAAGTAELVAEKLSASTVRGRRVQARVDRPREARGGERSREARGGERSREARGGERSREARGGERSREARGGERSREMRGGGAFRGSGGGRGPTRAGRPFERGERSERASPGRDPRGERGERSGRDDRPGQSRGRAAGGAGSSRRYDRGPADGRAPSQRRPPPDGA